jgi:mannosyltransferase OCH1-like enzyme
LFLLLLASLAAEQNLPPFEDCMRLDNTYAKGVVSFPKEWSRVHKFYTRYLQKRAVLNPAKATYRIPKKIHAIWIGSPVPPFAKKMIQTWKRYHPTWEVKIWTEADLKTFKFRNKKAFDTAKNLGEKSDIWRYEILWQFGGLYVDCDFECLRPFDEFHQLTDFYTGLGTGGYGKPKLNNGLIGCRARHPIIQRCIKSLKIGNGDSSFSRILQTTGPLFFTNCFRKWLLAPPSPTPDNSGIVLALPISFFYAFPDRLRSAYKNTEEVKKDWTKNETFALHYWTLSWQ